MGKYTFSTSEQSNKMIPSDPWWARQHIFQVCSSLIKIPLVLGRELRRLQTLHRAIYDGQSTLKCPARPPDSIKLCCFWWSLSGRSLLLRHFRCDILLSKLLTALGLCVCECILTVCWIRLTVDRSFGHRSPNKKEENSACCLGLVIGAVDEGGLERAYVAFRQRAMLHNRFLNRFSH